MSKLPPISASSKECFMDASRNAQSQGKMMGSSHFVYSLLTYADNAMFDFIKLIGADPEEVTKSVQLIQSQEPNLGSMGNDNKTSDVYGALSSLQKIMDKVGDTKATVEIILASFCNGQDKTAKTLVSYGVNESKIVEAILHLRNTSNASETPSGVADTKTLSKFGEDLTAKAREGKIDPVIGRDSETRRVMQILSRRTKNNPVIVGEPGVGKALDDNTLIPVNDDRRYAKVSDLQVGDEVFDRLGQPSIVIGVYPQGKKDSYRITFNDGTTVVCSGGHLWTGWIYSDYMKNEQSDTLSLYEIMQTLKLKGKNRVSVQDSWIIPRSLPIHRDAMDYGISPYVIGVVAASGNSTHNPISISTSDSYIPYKVASLLPHTHVEKSLVNSDWLFYQSIQEGTRSRKRMLGYSDLSQWEDISAFSKKHRQHRSLPQQYLYGSYQQRLELLQGVMDVCGEVGRGRPGDFQCCFSTASKLLADDVMHLLNSLGLRAISSEHKGIIRLDIFPEDMISGIFSTPNKVIAAQDMRQKDKSPSYAKETLHITKVESVGKRDSTCIYVDNPEHLFLCGTQHIVTHNTAIIEGLSRRIVSGDCPEQLKDKTIYALDLAALSAGAKYQGEYEERVKDVLSDIKKAEGKIITFIDEIHMIASGDGSPMNLSNMLKPMLARGEMHLIGATTLSEYRQFITSDPALDRRFQQVLASEPSVEDTIGILRGIKEKYESHHGIKIQDSSLISCAELSDRYLSSRFLPDKAIDLMDEASSRLTMLIDSRPEEIDTLEKKVRSLEIEEVALKNEDDSTGTSLMRLEEVQQELTEHREQLSSSKSRWENQREGTERMRRLRQNLSRLQDESDKAEREGDYTKVSDLRYNEIPAIKEKIKQEEEAAKSQGIDTRLISEEVTPDIVADVVSSMTGVPANKMNESDIERVMSMGDDLSKEVVGQPEAVQALVKAVKRSRAGVSNPHRPVGNFLFAGPSGTGKTQLSKALARYLYDDSKALISFSMEEYSDKASINKLIGSPAGYVGYGDTPALEAVRNRPSSVVLFDELEKADDQVIIALLSIMEEGRITLNNGSEVDFTNTIIIFTSNLGAGESKEGMDAAIKARLRPEFINRLDAVIAFNSLGIEELEKVVDIQIRILEENMRNKKLSFVVTDKARNAIAHMGHDPAYGARPVRRIIAGTVSDMLADSIITGKVEPGDTVTIDVDENGDIYLKRGNVQPDDQLDEHSGKLGDDHNSHQDHNSEKPPLLDTDAVNQDDDPIDDLDELFRM